MIESRITPSQLNLLCLIGECNTGSSSCQPRQRWISHALHQSRNDARQDPLYQTVSGQYAEIKFRLRNDLYSLSASGLVSTQGQCMELTEAGYSILNGHKRPEWIMPVAALVKEMITPDAK